MNSSAMCHASRPHIRNTLANVTPRPYSAMMPTAKISRKSGSCVIAYVTWKSTDPMTMIAAARTSVPTKPPMDIPSKMGTMPQGRTMYSSRFPPCLSQ